MEGVEEAVAGTGRCSYQVPEFRIFKSSRVKLKRDCAQTRCHPSSWVRHTSIPSHSHS